MPSADSAEREVRSFFAPFVAEDSTVAPRRPDRTVRDVARPAGEGDFFVPLATESPGLGAAIAEEAVVLRKRKQRRDIPLGAIVACLAGCVLIVGLIIYQKTKGPTGAAIAIKAAVEGQRERPAAESPVSAGTREDSAESPAAKDHKAQPGAGNARRRTIPAPKDSDKDSDDEDATPLPP